MGSAEQEKSNPDGQHHVTLDEALQLAQGHHQSGNYVLAERTYRDILRAVPDHFPTTQYLGGLLFQSGNYDEARDFFEIAVKSEPDDINCLNNFGGVLIQMKSYEEALEYLNRALEIDPDFIDALNNKVYVLWLLERYKEAEKICRHALTLSHNDWVALNSLGMILAKMVQYEDAFDAWELAIKSNPEKAMLWSNWGNALREMGRLPDALEKCQKAVELDPDNPEALNNLGNVLRDQGKLEESIELYRKATNERPEYALSHCNLAIALYDDGRYEDAVISARYAVAFKKDFVEAYSVLSSALGEMGEYPQAHISAQRALHYADKDAATPYLDLADVLSRLDQFDDCEAALFEALKREPESARAYMKLSEIRERMNRYEEAHDAVDRALELSPDMAKLWVRKSMVFFMSADPESALEAVEKAISLAPNWPAALQQKAEILVATNRNEEAEAMVRKMLELSKEVPAPYIMLTSLKNFESEDDPDFVEMRALEDKAASFGKDVESNYYFGMSDAYEMIGDYDKAFEYLKKGNDVQCQIRPPTEALDTHAATVEVRKSRFTPAFIKQLEGHGCPSDVPIFIVGMPRSGTTLTEQILSSHPDVYGAGEMPFIGDVNRMQDDFTYGDIKAMGEDYVALLKARDRTGEARKITDKMPGNAMHIGFINAILPNAKIIHCRRNPIDTCLSCYKQNFALGHYWSYDLEDMANHYLVYEDMMQHWREVLPDRFLEIDYEETVNNFEEQARKLIDYVGLEWDDACLEPHKQKRTVLTASRAQVTKPVYKTSVDKWKRYEEGLQPLVRKLRPDWALPEDKLKKKDEKSAKKKTAKS